MFRPLDHIECVDNSDEPKLVIGAFYSVKDVWVLDKKKPGDDWSVEVYGHEGVRFLNSCFAPISRRPTVADFDRGFATSN